jgi:hypothetical protein
MQALVGQEAAFDPGRQPLKLRADLELTTKAVKKETMGRSGKTAGQPAHTREAKLGRSFTPTTWDQEGHAIRDPDSTTYAGPIETAEEFGKRIYLEAWNAAGAERKTKWSCAMEPNGSGTFDQVRARKLGSITPQVYPSRRALRRIQNEDYGGSNSKSKPTSPAKTAAQSNGYDLYGLA